MPFREFIKRVSDSSLCCKHVSPQGVEAAPCIAASAFKASPANREWKLDRHHATRFRGRALGFLGLSPFRVSCSFLRRSPLYACRPGFRSLAGLVTPSVVLAASSRGLGYWIPTFGGNLFGWVPASVLIAVGFLLMSVIVVLVGALKVKFEDEKTQPHAGLLKPDWLQSPSGPDQPK